MQQTDTGDLAFPHSRLGSDADGMTLRDYFAAKAMQAFLRNLPPHDVEELYSTWAQDAYEMADAMLEARAE